MSPTDTVLQQMMTTIIDGQKQIADSQKQQADDIRQQAADIRDIRSSMKEIIKIEAQQANQKEALTRIGGDVDRLRHWVETETEKLHKRVNDLDDIVTDLRILSARLVTKVSLIAGGSGAGVGSILLFAFEMLRKSSGG